MTSAEALRVVAMLTSYFRAELSDETAVLWASGLLEFDRDDGVEAARICGENLRFMPALAEFVETCRGAHRRRVPSLLDVGSTVPIALADALARDPELKARWERVKAGPSRDVGVGRDGDSAASGTPDRVASDVPAPTSTEASA